MSNSNDIQTLRKIFTAASKTLPEGIENSTYNAVKEHLINYLKSKDKEAKAKEKAAEAKAAKPKRGPTGYFLFMKENRADIVKNHSDCPVTEIASKLGEMWRSLDESKRAEWNAKAKELAPKPTPEQIAAVEAKASKPKRPPTAFFNYMSKMRDNIKKQHPDWTVTQISSHLGEQWRSLNKEEKDKFKSTDKSI